MLGRKPVESEHELVGVGVGVLLARLGTEEGAEGVDPHVPERAAGLGLVLEVAPEQRQALDEGPARHAKHVLDLAARGVLVGVRGDRAERGDCEAALLREGLVALEVDHEAADGLLDLPPTERAAVGEVMLERLREDRLAEAGLRVEHRGADGEQTGDDVRHDGDLPQPEVLVVDDRQGGLVFGQSRTIGGDSLRGPTYHGKRSLMCSGELETCCVRGGRAFERLDGCQPSGLSHFYGGVSARSGAPRRSDARRAASSSSTAAELRESCRSRPCSSLRGCVRA
jgi:hypothetical protein